MSATAIVDYVYILQTSNVQLVHVSLIASKLVDGNNTAALHGIVQEVLIDVEGGHNGGDTEYIGIQSCTVVLGLGVQCATGSIDQIDNPHITVGVSGSVILFDEQNVSLKDGIAKAVCMQVGKHAVNADGPNGDVSSSHESKDKNGIAALKLDLSILSLGACAKFVQIILTVSDKTLEGVEHMSIAIGCQLGKAVIAVTQVLVVGLVDKKLGVDKNGATVLGKALNDLVALGLSGVIGIVATVTVTAVATSAVTVTSTKVVCNVRNNRPGSG